MKSFLFLSLALITYGTNAIIESSTINAIIRDILSGRYITALNKQNMLPILVETATSSDIEYIDAVDISSILWLKAENENEIPELVHTTNCFNFRRLDHEIFLETAITGITRSKNGTFSTDIQDFREIFSCEHHDQYEHHDLYDSSTDNYHICPLLLTWPESYKEARFTTEELLPSIQFLFSSYNNEFTNFDEDK